MKINSRWVVEKGRWDENECTYINRKKETFERFIGMQIEDGNTGKLIRFIGGPTGFESYYIEDLLSVDSLVKELCICAGTINRWPACYVDKQTVFDFIKEQLL